MLNKETIAAISTGMSNSGIGIVRISGDDAFQIIDRIYKGKKKLSEADSHTIHYGFIKDGGEPSMKFSSVSCVHRAHLPGKIR